MKTVKSEVYKLGSKAWKVLKQKTKTKVKQIAFNFIKLYAKEKQNHFQYSPDSYLQHELEALYMRIPQIKLQQPLM